MLLPKIQGKENFFVEVLDPKHYANYLAEEISSITTLLAEKQSKVTVCLSGGRTPLDIYRHLSTGTYKMNLPWSKVVFFLGDERWTNDVNMRNDTAILEHLFKGISNYSFITWNGDSIDEATENFLTQLRGYGILNNGFDLLLLGIGEDGHIASIFPGYGDHDEIVLSVSVPNQIPRVTIGPRLIRLAKRIIVLVKGENKKDIVRKIFYEKNLKSSVPAEIIFECTGLVYFFLDYSSAQLL